MDASLARKALEAAIVAAMENAGERAMAWGIDDCGLWCADILRSVLNYDPAWRWRGKYDSQETCTQLLGSGGVARAVVAAAYSSAWNEIKPEEAQAGDIGILKAKDRTSVVICRAPGWFVGRNEHGWTALKARGIERAFAVL